MLCNNFQAHAVKPSYETKGHSVLIFPYTHAFYPNYALKAGGQNKCSGLVLIFPAIYLINNIKQIKVLTEA